MSEATPERRFTGFWIPVEIIDATGLSWIQRLLWAEIYSLHDIKRGSVCWASNAHLGKIFEIAEGSVANGLTALRKAGFLEDVAVEGRVCRCIRAVLQMGPLEGGGSLNSEGGSLNSEGGVHQTVKGGSLNSEHRYIDREKNRSTPALAGGEELFLEIPTSTECSPDDQAAALYALYPRKKDRGHALPAIKRALKKVPFATLKEAVEAYARERAGKDQEHTPYPATWFNGLRWEDAKKGGSHERLW